MAAQAPERFWYYPPGESRPCLWCAAPIQNRSAAVPLASLPACCVDHLLAWVRWETIMTGGRK